MNDAQTWTLIAGFLAVTVAMNTLLLRLVRSEISGLRNEMIARFETVHARLDAIDRDVQRLYERFFHEREEGQ